MKRLLEDTFTQAQNIIDIPADAGPVALTQYVMARLQTLTLYIEPVGVVLKSLGEGGWIAPGMGLSTTAGKAFQLAPDGEVLFSAYAGDTLEALVRMLESKAKQPGKSQATAGIFVANNIAIIDRAIRTTDLRTYLAGLSGKMEGWRRKALSAYTAEWKECSILLFDVQYATRGGPAGSIPPAIASLGQGNDSATIVKSLGSKERDAIKEKFKKFNVKFDELISRHRQLRMEPEVRAMVHQAVTTLIEPLYGRFWDRYHEIDKGRGKHVKYDKAGLAAALKGLA